MFPLAACVPKNSRSAPAPSSLLTNLQAYYAFETLTTDSSGNGNTLTNNAGVTQGTGIIGQAASFAAASSQFFNRNDNATIDFFTVLSISFWEKFNTVGINQCPISKGLFATDMEWSIQALAANNLRFNLGDASAGINAVAAGVTLTTGTWYHVAIVYDGNQTGNANRCKMWINGAAQTLSFTGTFPNTNAPGTNPLFIGKLGGAFPQYTDGLIDELGLWRTALMAGQVSSLYNSGAGMTPPFTGVP